MSSEKEPLTFREPEKALSPKKPRWPIVLYVAVLLLSFCVLLVVLLDPFSHKMPQKEPETVEDVGVDNLPAWVRVELIAVDGASRRGEALEAVRDIAVHYVANPGSGAMANRNYFNSPDSTTSSHFVVGLEGEVILCVPLDEKSSATNERNRDTISIEVCHPDETGRVSQQTSASLIRLLSYLLEEFDLDRENIIRHYDVTGKLCPKYYVEHPDAWEEIKSRVSVKESEQA